MTNGATESNIYFSRNTPHSVLSVLSLPPFTRAMLSVPNQQESSCFAIWCFISQQQSIRGRDKERQRVVAEKEGVGG